MSVVPVFKDNVETSSILASSTIHMLEEIPDTQKAYINTPANIINEVSASFQNPNLNQWVQGEIELVFQRTFEFRGKTEPPTDDNTDSHGTAPFLWNPVNSTFDGLCLNKLISEIKFSIANKQFTEVDRQNPEMIDMFALQFDQDMLKSYGIYGEDGLKNSTEHQQNFVNGSDLIRPRDIVGFGNYGQGLLAGGFSTNYQNDYTKTLQPWQQNTKGYVKVVSNTYAYLSAPTTLLPTSNRVDGYEGIDVPVLAPGSTTPVFTTDADTLVQIVTLELHEFIVSPNLSNPYSKNPHKKIYYSGGYPFNLSLTFNQDYAKSMFKWQPSVRASLGNSGLNNGVATMTSSQWTKAEMRFWTFDSSKPLPSEPIKTIYYKQELQTPVPRTFNPQTAVASDSISTSNLSSLPYYIFVYAVARPSSNPAWFTQRGNNPYAELLPIKSINLRLGTQADALASMDIYKEELVRHTMLTLGNQEFRDLLSSNATVLEVGDLGQITGSFTAPTLLVPIQPTNMDKAQPNYGYNRGFPFYILDVAKLNLRTLDGLPILPGVNYGSTAFKSLTLKVDYEGTFEMKINNLASVSAELNMVLMEKRIRTLPLLSGNMTDDKVEYNINDVSAELMQRISSGYSGNGENQLAYVGGSFLGSVWDTIKGYLQHPTLKSIARITRKLRDETENEESDILRGVNKVTSGLAKMADFAGLGRKSKYSKV